MIIKVKVIPNSKTNEIRYNDLEECFIVKITEKPERGKANMELVRYLEELLNCKVKIIRGEKSRNKLIKLEEVGEETLKILDKIRKS